MIDCTSLPERLREICDGTAIKADGSTFTLHQRRVIISKRFNIPIAAVQFTDTGQVVGHRPEKSQIGTRLKQIITDYQGAEISCSDCKNEIMRLNLMTVDEVKSDAGNIAAGIVTRGTRLASKWYQRFAAKHAPGLVASFVVEWINKACTDEENNVLVESAK